MTARRAEPGSLRRGSTLPSPVRRPRFGEFGDRQGGVGDSVRPVVGSAEHAEDLLGEVVDGGVVDQGGLGECQLQGGEQGSGDGGAGQAGFGGLEATGRDAGLDVRAARGGPILGVTACSASRGGSARRPSRGGCGTVAVPAEGSG
jgi:hypothetical protein